MANNPRSLFPGTFGKDRFSTWVESIVYWAAPWLRDSIMPTMKMETGKR